MTVPGVAGENRIRLDPEIPQASPTAAAAGAAATSGKTPATKSDDDQRNPCPHPRTLSRRDGQPRQATASITRSGMSKLA